MSGETMSSTRRSAVQHLRSFKAGRRRAASTKCLAFVCRNGQVPSFLLAGMCSCAACDSKATELATLTPSARPNPAISGLVRDRTSPVAGAVVRIIGTRVCALTSLDGTFSLSCEGVAKPVDLSAWAPGYFIGSERWVVPGQANVAIELSPHPTQDDPSYQWISAFAGVKQPLTCQHCMSSGRPGGSLPFEEWRRDAHSQSSTNSRFLTMYNGTDLTGRKSAPTRYTMHRDYGRIPLRPDPAQSYYGPGFKLDFPDSAGNCSSCHLPAASVNTAYQTDPNTAKGTGREGVTCDICHKLINVRLNESTGLPFPNMPGVLSYDFLRPRPSEQIFIGPYDDVPGHSIYSPLQNRSELCAPCHFGVFWNVQVYNSFGEWLESPYADPQNGKTCQDCHMPHVGATRIAQPPARSARIAYDRDPQTIFSHAMPGASDTNLLQNAVTLYATARRETGRVVVRVSVKNDKTGHHVPSDSPLRHLILLVNAADDIGKPLSLMEGATLPAWTGRGDVRKGNYAGQPGKVFAKVLEELWTEVSPTAAYWNPTRILEDNRIPAMGKDDSVYVFTASDTGGVNVNVSLLYRRAFKTLADQKGWNVPDVLMAQQRITVSR